MTERDLEVLDFINLIGICRSTHLKELFFKDCSKTVLNRRTAKLAEYGEVKRFRSDLFEREYIYYSDKKPNPRILRHDLYVTDLATKLIKSNIEILTLDRNVVIGNIISDSFIVIRKDNVRRAFLVEVQLSGKLSDCTDKYKDLDIIREFAEIQGLNIMPRLLIISNLKGSIKTKMKYIKLDCDLSNIQDCFL